jgi:hypothetical protein
LWLIFAAPKRGLNLEKSCQKNTIGCGQWASSAEPRPIWKKPKHGAKWIEVARFV